MAAALAVAGLWGCGAPPSENAEDARAPQAAEPSVPALEVVNSPAAPEAIGPYSQAIRVGHTLYLAGQIGQDPESGDLVPGGIEAETRQVMTNLRAVLQAAGLGFEHVVQSQVFLVDLEEFGAMNRIYAEYFQEAPPARATVQVPRLPRDARIEILMTAVGPRP